MALQYLIESVDIYQATHKNLVLIQGWAISDDGIVPKLRFVQNGKETEAKMIQIVRNDVLNKINESTLSNLGIACGFSILNRSDENLDTIQIFADCDGNKEIILDLKKNEIKKYEINHSIMYSTDLFRYEKENGVCEVSGWAVSILNEPIKFKILDNKGNDLNVSYHEIMRNDLSKRGLVDDRKKFCGFQVRFPASLKEKYDLIIYSDSDKITVNFSPSDYIYKKGAIKSILTNINLKNIRKAHLYLKRNGFWKTLERLGQGVEDPETYDNWFKEHRVTETELTEQKYAFFEYKPKISIIVPTFNTPLDLLREMIDSVRNQSYENWELCIADASDSEAPAREELLQYAQKDDRIKINILDDNYGISGNTNKALELATGDYTGLLDHDDFLELDALYEVVKLLNVFPYDSLYTDEDKYEMGTNKFADPNFKPDFAIDSLCSHNYITHFFVARTDLIKEVGGEHSEYDGSQDYDLIFRCTEKSNKVGHISKVLYHWRIHPGSTAGDPEQKLYCYESGRKAIEDHFKRINVPATVETIGKPYWGLYHVHYETSGNPLVSIIIPNYENKNTLERCINSLFTVNSYKNIEIIIVENNSKSNEIFDYYHKLETDHNNIHVKTWSGGEFNYSAINNYGVKYANGDYILLLNNDTEMINPDSIKELLGTCMRSDVGAVGAKLLYADDTVQHAGVVIGFGGVAGHVFSRIDKNDSGYMMRALINYNYSAVTGACMMTKKSLYNEVGGLDENLKVAFNDIDYCLKIRNLGKVVVYNAFSLWHHYESVSRGYENDPKKIRRYDAEVKYFQERWKTVLEAGDPFYNKNFDINYTPFEIH